MKEVIRTVKIHLFISDESMPPNEREITKRAKQGFDVAAYSGYVESLSGENWLNPFGDAFYCELCSQIHPGKPYAETADGHACKDCYEENKEDSPEDAIIESAPGHR